MYALTKKHRVNNVGRCDCYYCLHKPKNWSDTPDSYNKEIEIYLKIEKIGED